MQEGRKEGAQGRKRGEERRAGEAYESSSLLHPPKADTAPWKGAR